MGATDAACDDGASRYSRRDGRAGALCAFWRAARPPPMPRLQQLRRRDCNPWRPRFNLARATVCALTRGRSFDSRTARRAQTCFRPGGRHGRCSIGSRKADRGAESRETVAWSHAARPFRFLRLPVGQAAHGPFDRCSEDDNAGVALAQRCSYPGCTNIAPASRCPDHQTGGRSPSSRQRGRISARRRDAIRRAVLARDHHACQVCGKPATQVDHVVPAARHVRRLRPRLDSRVSGAHGARVQRMNAGALRRFLRNLGDSVFRPGSPAEVRGRAQAGRPCVYRMACESGCREADRPPDARTDPGDDSANHRARAGDGRGRGAGTIAVTGRPSP